MTTSSDSEVLSFRKRQNESPKFAWKVWKVWETQNLSATNLWPSSFAAILLKLTNEYSQTLSFRVQMLTDFDVSKFDQLRSFNRSAMTEWVAREESKKLQGFKLVQERSWVNTWSVWWSNFDGIDSIDSTLSTRYYQAVGLIVWREIVQISKELLGIELESRKRFKAR